MKKNFVRISLLALTLALFDSTAHAQPASEFQPQVGQDGKDVIWVPTPQALVDKMLDMAKVTPKDYVIDLGSGDRSEERRVGKECRSRWSPYH